MNVYWRELRSQRWSLLWWLLGLAFLLVASWAKFATLSAPGTDVLKLLDSLPKSVQVIFGLSGFNLQTTKGYFGVIYYFTALMLAVHAVLAATDLVSKEERDRTSEFVFVRPVTRARVLTGKLLAGLTAVLLLNAATWGLSVALLREYGGAGQDVGYLPVAMLGLLGIQLFFFALGALVSGVNGRPKSSGSIATAFLLLTYLASVLTQFSDQLAFLKHFSPFSFFDAHQILADNSVDPLYGAITGGLVVVMVWIGYFSYGRRDLAV